jgi:uncharacterized OB-fold protein
MDIPRTWRLRFQRYRLQGTECEKCGKLSFPPVIVCKTCKSRSHKPYTFAGKGKVYSYTVLYQAPARFEPYVPYIVALIDLEEGPRITAQLTDVSPEEVEIGMLVEMVVRKISDEGERGLIFYGYKFRPPVISNLLNP